MFEKNSTIRASCHCGSIKLDVFLANGLDSILRCNCSMCRRDKGFGMICVPTEDVLVISGIESMTEYTFRTETSPHVFCIVCGVHTHHKGRAAPNKLCINVCCLEGFDSSSYKGKVTLFDGINHFKDR